MTGWHQGYGYDGFGGLGMFLAMLLFWVPLIGLGVWLVSRVTRSDRPPAAPTVVSDSARGILDRRFAAGEITAEEYTEMRRVLESGARK